MRNRAVRTRRVSARRARWPSARVTIARARGCMRTVHRESEGCGYSEGPLRHVWRIGQPLHLVSHWRAEGARREVPQQEVSPHARSMNETEIGGRCSSFPVRCTTHGTDGDHKVITVSIVTTRATDNHHAHRPLLRRNRGEEIRPVCAAVRVRAVVHRVYTGAAPEAESPATRPGVLEAVRWRACGSLGR